MAHMFRYSAAIDSRFKNYVIMQSDNLAYMYGKYAFIAVTEHYVFHFIIEQTKQQTKQL